MQWMTAIFGLLFMLVGVVVIFVGLVEKFEGGRQSQVPVVLFALFFAILGAWLANPIFAGIRDLVLGTHHAQEIIEARKASNAASDHREYMAFQKVVEFAGIAYLGLALPLCWSMRRRDPGSRRPWVVLATGMSAGYVVLVHWNFHLLPSGYGGDLMEEPLRLWLSRHEGMLAFGLYTEFFWMSGLAASNFTGLPVGPWAAFLSPVALLPGCVASYLDFSGWKLALCCLLTIILGIILNQVRQTESEGETLRRAERALELSSKLLEADERKRPRYALYLRPFVSTGTLDTQSGSNGADTLDLETVLSYAVLPELSLIGLNRPAGLGIVGAGYIYGADQDWYQRFLSLAHNATIIFLLPSARLGTLEEVQWVADSHAFGKCIFLMPETITGGGYQAYVSLPSPVQVKEDRFIDHAPDWERARAAVFEHVKLQLPEYQESGALFTLDEGGDVKRLEPLQLSRSTLKVMRLRKAIRRMQLIG